jgi:hypothetical protein
VMRGRVRETWSRQGDRSCSNDRESHSNLHHARSVTPCLNLRLKGKKPTSAEGEGSNLCRGRKKI